MLGAIIGDIVGSRFEWDNIKTKEFDFLTYKCSVTDDSIMSLAVAKAIVQCDGDYSALSKNAVKYMQEIGRPYPFCGYGGMFRQWMYSDDPKPYGSYGNGAAMRVSACGFAATSMDEAIELSRKVTEVTHNHPEGIKGAEATAVAIYMARTGSGILEIRDYINNNYYPMNFTLDGIRDSYSFNETCQDTVPQAIMAFLESENFEDAIRNAISIGGDSDTLAAITGGIAEAYYGIPAEIRKHALTFLDELQLSVLNEFEAKFGFTSNKKTENGSRVVKYVPIIPIGHSAMATYPWNFAAWNPERTLAVISLHGDAPRTNLCGYGRENLEWGRTRNIDGIPGLMIEGEYEWWEARVNPALAFRMKYPDSCISFLCDTGRGHFDVSPQTADYIALFIRKALEWRYPQNQNIDSPVALKKVNMKAVLQQVQI